ncbi:DUF3667 domain-containing protein [Bacteroidota bacterium]
MKQTENKTIESTVCKNCGSKNIESFCSECGQKTYTEKFTLKSFFAIILQTFDIDRGFLYTLKMLFKDPGKIIHEYLNGRTKGYFNPLKYLLIIVGIDTLLLIWLNIFNTDVATTNELFGQAGEVNKLQEKLILIIKQYHNLIALLNIPFSSLVSKWFYRKHKLFYGEHLILICFLTAQLSAIIIVSYILYLAWPAMTNYQMIIANLIALIYLSYGLKKVFEGSLLRSVFGAILINIGGAILSLIFFSITVWSIIFFLAKIGHPIKDLL